MIATAKTIGEVMSKTVLFAKPSHSFTELCRLFTEMEIHHLPVISEDNRLIGMLSSTDVLKAYSFKVPVLEKADEETLNKNITIEDLMTPQPLVTVSPKESIWDAAQKFRKHHIHAMPVVEGEKVVGIFTSNDFIATCATLDPEH